ncbi:hypothetical protein DITRI_Ditri20bG0073800 [Diplodiscus trichospermus]
MAAAKAQAVVVRQKERRVEEITPVSRGIYCMQRSDHEMNQSIQKNMTRSPRRFGEIHIQKGLMRSGDDKYGGSSPDRRRGRRILDRKMIEGCGDSGERPKISAKELCQ